MLFRYLLVASLASIAFADKTCRKNGGQALCSGVCVDTDSNNSNCGKCGKVCPTNKPCTNGQCTKSGSSTCQSNETLCGRTCVDTSVNVNHCGNCATQCSAGQTCQAGICTSPTPPSQCTDTYKTPIAGRCFSTLCGQTGTYTDPPPLIGTTNEANAAGCANDCGNNANCDVAIYTEASNTCSLYSSGPDSFAYATGFDLIEQFPCDQ